MATQDSVKHYAKVLAELGYATYYFDFNGGCAVNGKSDGKTTEMSVLTEVRDLKAVIAYAKNLSYTDSDKVLLMGCSQGGFVSALTAAELKEEINKLILIYPAFCIPDDARAGQMMFAKFDPDNVPEIVDCGPMKLGSCYVLDVINMDPFKEIKEYMGDVLIVHGTEDEIVKLDYAKKAEAAYLSNTVDKKRTIFLGVIAGGKHGFSPKQDKIVFKMMRDFVGR